MTRSGSFLDAFTRSPLVWGGLVAGLFYGVIHLGWIQGPFVEQYFTGHVIEYVTIVMFFVGMATLGLKFADARVQSRRMRRLLQLGQPASHATGTQIAEDFLQRLDRLPRDRQHDWIVERLRNALLFVRRQKSAARLDDQLKYLADLDLARAQDGYSLVRVIIWAIPILGFLGTVVGLTMAIANIDPAVLVDNPQEVVGGLAVAFSTTALALSLSLLLMFSQFVTDRAESTLLADVDDHVERILGDRFEPLAAGHDEHVAAFRRAVDLMSENMERLVTRQAELWNHSIDSAGKRWASMAGDAHLQLQNSLKASLGETYQLHARQLGEQANAAAQTMRQTVGELNGHLQKRLGELDAGEQARSQQTSRQWEQVHRGLVRVTEEAAAVQKGMNQQAELLHRTVAATGKVAQLEETLSRNLQQLRETGNFEQTLSALAAAIHLLNARLGGVQLPSMPHEQTHPNRAPGKAA